jgi:purine-binding chemotaxis protein CheW
MNVLAEKNKLQLLHFTVQKNHFCLELNFIQQVLPLVSLKMIPNSQDNVVGLLNLAGLAITVIDLATRVGIPRHENYSINSPILLCTAGELQLGLIIDTIFGIEEVERQSIQMRPEFQKPSSFFLGAVQLENEMTFLFNIHALLKGK